MHETEDQKTRFEDVEQNNLMFPKGQTNFGDFPKVILDKKSQIHVKIH